MRVQVPSYLKEIIVDCDNSEELKGAIAFYDVKLCIDIGQFKAGEFLESVYINLIDGTITFEGFNGQDYFKHKDLQRQRYQVKEPREFHHIIQQLERLDKKLQHEIRPFSIKI